MRAIAFLIVLLAASAAVAAPTCVGLGCPYYMVPLGDGSLLDKQIAICNQHALPAHQGWEPDFAKCRDVFNQWAHTPNGEDAAAAAAKRAADAAIVNSVGK